MIFSAKYLYKIYIYMKWLYENVCKQNHCFMFETFLSLVCHSIRLLSTVFSFWRARRQMKSNVLISFKLVLMQSGTQHTSSHKRSEPKAAEPSNRTKKSQESVKKSAYIFCCLYFFMLKWSESVFVCMCEWNELLKYITFTLVYDWHERNIYVL